MKQRDLSPKAHDLLVEQLKGTNGLEVLGKQWTVNFKLYSEETRHDFSLFVKDPSGKLWRLNAEVKTVGHPKQAREAAYALRRSLEEDQETKEVDETYSIFVAPYISPESAKVCEEEGVGYFDLSGNCHLVFGGLYIHVEGKPNSYKPKRELTDLFSPKATQVLRVLIQGPLRPWKVKKLAEKASVSLGLVSGVRKSLLAQEWAKETKDGLLVSKPDSVLEAWAGADRWAKRTTVSEYSLLQTDPEEIAKRLHNLLRGKKHAFTQWFAAFLRHPYTVTPLTSVYVDEFPDDLQLKEVLNARRVESGGRLRVVLPKDDSVFLASQTIQGLPVVSDIQIYLDLVNAGLRGDEAAKELRKWPDFSGGWQ